MSTVLLFNNREYISSRDAAQHSGYTTDYISKLCRLEKIQGKLVGKIWYVEKDSLNLFLEAQDRAKVEIQKKLSEERKADYRAQVFNRTVSNVIDVVPPRGADLFRKAAKGSFAFAVVVLLVGLTFSVTLNGTKPTQSAVAEITSNTKTLAISTAENAASAGSFIAGLAMQNPDSWNTLHNSFSNTKVANAFTAFLSRLNAIALNIHETSVAYINSLWGKFAMNQQGKITDAPKGEVPSKTTNIEPKNSDALVVVPGTGTKTIDAEKISKIQQTFSDEVSVVPSEDGQSGIIKPVFRDSSSNPYLYVLVPLNDKDANQGGQ